MANFNADTRSGCAPLVVNFHDLSTGNPTQWIWTLGNGTTSFLQHPTSTYFTPGTYHVKLVIKNASGADSLTRDQYITVFANPVIAFSLSDSIGCYPKTVAFTDKSVPGSGTITSRTWDFGDGNISSQQDPVHTYTNAGIYSVTLKAVNNAGCQKTLTRSNIIRLQNPDADFSFSGSTGCNATSTISFTDLSAGAITRQWYFGDGSSSLIANPLHTYGLPGTYDIKLVATGANGCKDSIVKTVLAEAVKANFSYTPVCVGAEISFQNISSPSPVSTVWDFGDGSGSTDINPVKKYAVAGNYQVRLISDFGGCSDTIVKTVVVHPTPSPAFTQVGELAKCVPDATVNFTALQDGMDYQWFFGDGAAANTKAPSHTYSAYGNYDVSLIVTSPFGCTDTLNKIALVKIQAPQITTIDGVFEGCAPYLATFVPIVSSVDAVTSWSWNLDDGATSTDRQPSHLYVSPGSYTVQLSITTAGGCVDTLIYPGAVRISNKPVAAFTAAPLVTCAAGPVQFTNNSTGAENYLWIFNDGGTSSSENPDHQFGDTGVFTITLIASSTGCRDTVTIQNYVRNDPPIARYNVVRDCNKPYEIQFRDSSLGGQTYLWRFGDGDSSLLKHPKHTYDSPGNYDIELTVYHGSCSYTTAGSVTIIDEHPLITMTDTAICRNQKIVFGTAGLNAANITQYQWEFGNDEHHDTAAGYAEYQYLLNGRYHPTLITMDALGCLDTASNPVELNVYGPYAGFRNQAGICLNTTAVFNDTSRADGIHHVTKWTWDFGDGNRQTFTAAPFAHMYDSKGIYNIQLKVTDSFGCEDSAYRDAAITIAQPVAAFASSDPVKCASNTVTFNNASEGTGLQNHWDFGDNQSTNGTHPLHAYTGEGTYFVSLKITDRFGCKDSLVKQQVISNPFAKFIASDTFASCPPLLVNLSNLSGSFSSVSWNFGDGSSADVNNPSHYYTYPGIYELKLRSQGFGNCMDSMVKTIVIKGPTGSFDIAPATICTNSSVQFTANSNGTTRFLWDFSDGNTSITPDSSISHVYEMPGIYQPRMILIDTAGCEVPVVSPDSIKVLGVKAKMSFDQKLFCDFASIQFMDSSVVHNDLPAHYQWTFGDGNASTQPHPLHHYSTSGVYTTKLVITTQAGCIDSVVSVSPVTIFKSPQIGISGNSSVCMNDIMNFAGTIIQPDTSLLRWNWSFANGNISSAQNPSQSFDTDGIYNVIVIATNSSGCSDTANRDILVHPLPEVSAGTDTMICRGKTYSLQPTGAATYEWQSDPTLSCTSCSSAIADPVFDKVYYVTGTSQFGCRAGDSIKIIVQQPFTMSVTRDDTLCKGGSVQLKASGAANYTWFPSTGLNSGSIGNPVAMPSVTTQYMVIGSDAKNCFKDTGYTRISVFLVPQFNIIDNAMTLPGGTVTKIITSGSPDITKWKWYPAKGLDCADCPEPTVTAKDNITYRAEASNDGGCTTADEVAITVICNDGNVFIPNTFSPNNDGMNDVFYPRGKGITSVKNMKIFNRWGELVYEKSNFSANDAAAGWNGSYKGSILTPDVYVYIVDVVCSNSTVFTLKGNVTLIR